MQPSRRDTLRAGLAVALSSVAPRYAVADERSQSRLLVFAAASTKPAIDPVLEAWRKSSGRKVAVSYAGSGQLARQIEQGAPADIFISADAAWMTIVAEKGLVDASTRKALLGNRLVLIAPAASTSTIALGPGLDLLAHLAGGRLATGHTRTVPAGQYARAALEKLGAWPGVAGRLAETENVRAALMLVARGEAPLGIVYATDAKSEPAVRIVATFPEDSHPRIVYPVALTKNARPGASDLLAFLTSPMATSIFEAHGFIVPARPG